MHIAYVVCDHGLGHLRRCYLNALKNLKAGAEVTLYASPSALACLKSKLPYGCVNIFSLHTKTTPLLFSKPLDCILGWLNNLPSLSHHEKIISDNLPEILSKYPHSELSAQFFWHDVLPEINIEYKDYCKDLLSIYKPTIKGDPEFSMPAVSGQSNYIPQKNPSNPLLINHEKSICIRDKILISGGSTRTASKLLSSLLLDIITTAPQLIPKLIVDNNILSFIRGHHSDIPIPHIEVASYQPSMFHQIAIAFCRPGLGIVSDLLSMNIPIIPISESDNQEIIYNSSIINKISGSNRIQLLKHFQLEDISRKYAYPN